MHNGYYMIGEKEKKEKIEKYLKRGVTAIFIALGLGVMINSLAHLPSAERISNPPRYRLYTQDATGPLKLNDDFYPDEILKREGADPVIYLQTRNGDFRILTRATAKDSLDSLIVKNAEDLVKKLLPQRLIP